VEFAALRSSGKVRLGLSATAAAASLYGAVVLFGLGPASPLALGSQGDRDVPVVRVPPHDLPVSGPVQRQPQASPGPARHRTVIRVRHDSAPRRPRPAAGLKGNPAKPSNAPAPSSAAPQPTVKVPVVSSSVPETPLTTTTPTLPEPPPITLPAVTVPPLPELPPPPSLPSLPQLPAPPPLPAP
jgi:hypothetical protein